METGDKESESFYGDYFDKFNAAGERLLRIVARIRRNIESNCGRDPVEHCKMRVKTAQSTQKKLRGRNLDATLSSALSCIHDIVGVRVVLTFIDDIYVFADRLRRTPGIAVAEEKDYVKDPKPNGYRSYHMIVSAGGIRAEIQLRTVAMDCWASLEHHLMYKHDVKNRQMIADELKRCADEISSTDINLQTIRDIIDNGASI
jgi:ppGpp synthetase/RelA/SpoT-type nucleotidyltranferase